MTVEQLKDKMRAEGMDPDTAKFTVSADGSVDIVDQPKVVSKGKTATPKKQPTI